MNDSLPKEVTLMEAIRNGEAWRKFADALGEAGHVIYDDPRVDSDRLLAEGTRSMTRLLVVATMAGIEIADPAYPRLMSIFNSTSKNVGNINPDCIYLYSRISPEYTYRISGRRGTSAMFEVTTMDSHLLAYPGGKWLRTIHQFEAGSDGEIEIILSATPHEKNWVPLDPDARWIYLRQYFYDWNNDIPSDVTIERIGATYPAPAIAPETIAAQMDALTKFVPGWYRGILDTLAHRFYNAPPDRLVFTGAPGGFEGISYGRGNFNITDDEAVVIEFEPPKDTAYWSVHLGNHYWDSLDWEFRQCSLNGHQATLDPDGKFRGVISIKDPGVPNWLDTGGHVKGLIACRMLRCGEPAATLRKVNLADVRRHLHPQTRTVSTEERHEILRLRMLGSQRIRRE